MSIWDKMTTERHTLELPQDMISEEGIKAVNQYLTNTFYDAYRELRTQYGEFDIWLNRDFPRDWVVGKGAYVGTFPRRVSSFLFKERKIKASSEVLSEIGNIARRHTSKHSHFEFDFTRSFNWRAGDFGDEGSCYWSSNTDARNMLAYYEALAIRFFQPGTDRGIGRAWIAPLHMESLVNGGYVRNYAGKEALISDCAVLFNGYGEYETIRIARLLATFLGVSYKPVEVDNFGGSGGTLWINHYRDGVHGGGRGFLLGLPEHLEPVTSVDLRYERTEETYSEDDDDEDEYASHCAHCGNGLYDGQVYHGPDGNDYCWNHFQTRFAFCDHCGEAEHRNRLLVTVYHRAGWTENWCENCRENTTACEVCLTRVSDDYVTWSEDDQALCPTCAARVEQEA